MSLRQLLFWVFWGANAPRLSSTPTESAAPLLAGAACEGLLPSQTATLVSGSTLPWPCVLPSGPTMPALMSWSRMMPVSACAPQALTTHLRGVPSVTVAHH